MVIKRVNPLSVAKIAAVLYAGIGVLVGLVFALIGMAGLATQFGAERHAPAIMGAFFGLGALIALPILYGVMGFVFTLIAAALFNVAARITGGVEIEVQ
jgi:hypothetical protein